MNLSIANQSAGNFTHEALADPDGAALELYYNSAEEKMKLRCRQVTENMFVFRKLFPLTMVRALLFFLIRKKIIMSIVRMKKGFFRLLPAVCLEKNFPSIQNNLTKHIV